MVPISHPVRRSVVTNIAGSVDATLTGNGGTPIAAADIVGGLSTKTIAFAAGETLKNATWDIVDDAAVEGTEGYQVTLSNPQPSGTLSVPSITGTVLDNDTSGGGGGDTVVFPTQTIKDTGYIQTGSARHKMEGTLVDTAPLELWMASNATGTEGLLFEATGFGFWKLWDVAAGQKNQLTQGANLTIPAGTPYSFVRDADSISLTIGGVVLFDFGETSTLGTYARLNLGTAQPVTITRLA